MSGTHWSDPMCNVVLNPPKTKAPPVPLRQMLTKKGDMTTVVRVVTVSGVRSQRDGEEFHISVHTCVYVAALYVCMYVQVVRQ